MKRVRRLPAGAPHLDLGPEKAAKGGAATKPGLPNQSRKTAHSQGWRPACCEACAEERPNRERLTKAGEWVRLCESCARAMKSELAVAS